MNILSPSILSADFSRLGEQIKQVSDAGVKYLHIDVMDGNFVPSISIGLPVIKSIRKISSLVFDVHLMIEKPERYVAAFAKAGADIITFHLEAGSDVSKTIDEIHSLGLKAGLSIKPGTDVEEVRPYLGKLDMILIMSVEPGFGGQKYIPESTDRIRRVRAMIEESGRAIDLEVDGGIYTSNVDVVLSAGANVIVAGSGVFKGSIEENIQEFHKRFQTV